MGQFQRCHGYPCGSASHELQPTGCPIPREQLCNTCIEVAEIDAQIIRTQSLLVDLAQQRIIARNKSLNQLHDPLLGIPLEIASQIFISYVDDTNSAFADQYEIYRSPSLFLASICKGWRQIALATPELWTSIKVQIYSRSTILLQAELLTQCLARSGNRFLDIILFAEETVADTSDGSFNLSPLFSALRECAPRWRELTLRIPFAWYGNFVGNLTCAPRLANLQLIPPAWSEGEDIFCLPKTPCLNSLNISDCLLSKVEVQWDNLTTFHATTMYIDEVFEVLRRATLLVRCNLGAIMDSIGAFSIPSTPIVHSSLKHMDLGALFYDSTVPAVSTFLNLIKLPTLDDLSIDCSDMPQAVSVPSRSLWSLFERSRCPLTKLSLCEDNFNGLDIISILEVLPTVTDLSLKGENMVTDYVLKRLGEEISLEDGTSQFRILPNRRSIKYTGKRAFSWRALLDAFYAGWNEVSGVTHSTKPSIPTFSTEHWTFSFRFLQFRKRIGFDYIDANIVSHFSRLQNDKLSLEIVDIVDGSDLIKASLQHHGINTLTNDI